MKRPGLSVLCGVAVVLLVCPVSSGGVAAGVADFGEFAELAEQWLRTDCSEGNLHCGFWDCEPDGDVDYDDLSFFAGRWLALLYSGTYDCDIPGFSGNIGISQVGDSVMVFLGGDGPYLGAVNGRIATVVMADGHNTGTIIFTFSVDGMSYDASYDVEGETGTFSGTRLGDYEAPTYVDVNDLPRFIETDFTELSKIQRISRFRSGAGHDYSDDFESCRSMKHYFEPRWDVDWSAIKVFSPVRGTISRTFEEWAGTQIWIQSEDYPALEVRIFHVELFAGLEEGVQVDAGQQIGTHCGSQTMQDIAVGVDTADGERLVSYFDVMSDGLFHEYQLRGLASRADAIISRDARDADPLACDGEQFQSAGNLASWVTLTD